MDWQLSWYRIMQPQAAMFKFRLPWDSGSSKYLGGDIYLPIWGPQTTTEARLVVSSPNQVRVLESFRVARENERERERQMPV